MTIKAIIIDISETILNGRRTIVTDTPQMVSELRKRNIQIFFASNDFSTAFELWSNKRIIFNITDQSYVLHKDSVGGLKGSKRFIQHICDKLNIKPYELLYLGDERFDCFEAVNSGVAFFCAAWSSKKVEYGIQVAKPLDFIDLLDTFFRKENLWYYTINSRDYLERQVVVRALLDPERATQSGVKNLLKSKGERGPRTIKNYPSDWYLSMHLFASIYLEGLHLLAGRAAIWCLYPGHKGPHKSVLNSFVSMTSKAFNERNFSDLITRHTPAIHSSSSRFRGQPVNLNNQFHTIHLNPDFKTLIKGKTVVVVDDFTTDAYSFETARNFILNAKAASVICIAVGKYPKPYFARSPKKNVVWDSFAISTITQDDFDAVLIQASIDMDALYLF